VLWGKPLVSAEIFPTEKKEAVIDLILGKIKKKTTANHTGESAKTRKNSPGRERKKHTPRGVFCPERPELGND